MIPVYVSNYVKLRVSDLPKKLVKDLHSLTRQKDPLYQQQLGMGYDVSQLNPHLYTRRYTRSGKTLLIFRGLLPAVARLFRRHNLPYRVINQTVEYSGLSYDCSIELRDYQVDPVATMIRKKQTLGRGPAGSGKTETCIYAACKTGQPTLVLVWQEEQQHNWLDRIPKYVSNVEVGGVGGAFDRPFITPFTVAMVQSARNYLPVLRDRFGCVICDEVQRFAARTLREVVNELPAQYRWGVSDDERRRDNRHFLLYATFGRVGWELPFGEGQCEVDIIVIPTDFQATSEAKCRSEVIKELTCDVARNNLIVDLACDLVFEGHKVIIWSDRREHCYTLDRMLKRNNVSSGRIMGKKETEDRAESERTKRGLKEGLIDVVLGTQVVEQSFSYPPFSAGIMTCDSYDPKLLRFKQMRGRIARPHASKDRAKLYCLWDHLEPSLRHKIFNIKRLYEISNNFVFSFYQPNTVYLR